jgi:hypothetical protein
VRRKEAEYVVIFGDEMIISPEIFMKEKIELLNRKSWYGI